MAVIWQLSAVQFTSHSLISGVIINDSCPVNKSNPNLLQLFWSTMRTYFSQPYCNQNIYLKINGQKYVVKTDYTGSFWLETDKPVAGTIEVYTTESDTPLAYCSNYPVLHPEKPANLAVISDIDDTILVSYTASLFKRLKTLFFKAPHQRQPISFVGSILSKVEELQGRIFYVSKSESNLFGVLTSIIQAHDIPQGHLFLTSYLRYNQLLNPKKGKHYKTERIRKVLDYSPAKRFLLLVDDTQRDMSIYHDIARHYPDQIAKIYIRRTIKSLSAKKKQQLEQLLALSIPVMYFSDQDDVDKELQFIEDQIR